MLSRPDKRETSCALDRGLLLIFFLFRVEKAE